ncbi:MAG: hypothetical protein ACJAZ2_000101 [Glaciecola sp.]|jgi:hypothetical protein
MKSLLKNEYLFFFTGLFLGLYFIVLPVVGFSFSHYPGDLGDGRLNLYFLEHSYKFLTFQLTESYWDAPFMYPAKQMLTYSDNLLGSTPIYGFFRFVGMDIFLSYQWWFVMVSLLNYLSAYLFLKYLTKNYYSAVLGAMIFAFSLALVSQLAHAQMFPRFGIPLAFLMALKFHKSLSSKHFFWTVFFVVYQIYCGIYLGFLLIVPLMIYLTYIAIDQFKILKEQIKSRSWLKQIAFGLIVNVSLLAWLIIPYLKHSKNNGKEPYDGVLETLPTLQSYFMTGNSTPLWSYLSSVGSTVQNRWEFEIFPGGIAMLSVMICFVVIGYKKWSKKHVSSAMTGLFICGVCTFLLFLKIGDKSLYFFVYSLPGYSAMRSMARIINVELLFFAIGASYVFSLLFNKHSIKNSFLFLIFACVLTLDNYSTLENVSRHEKQEAQDLLIPMQKTMNNLPEGSVVTYEPEMTQYPSYVYQISAMLASQENNIKVINGYSGNSPAGYNEFWHKVNHTSRNYWLSFNEVKFDSLYVLNVPTSAQVYSREEIIKSADDQTETNFEIQVAEMIKTISFDSLWIAQIRKKGDTKGISLDSALYEDAVWLINNIESKRKIKQAK